MIDLSLSSLDCERYNSVCRGAGVTAYPTLRLHLTTTTQEILARSALTIIREVEEIIDRWKMEILEAKRLSNLKKDEKGGERKEELLRYHYSKDQGIGEEGVEEAFQNIRGNIVLDVGQDLKEQEDEKENDYHLNEEGDNLLFYYDDDEDYSIFHDEL